MCPPTVDAVDGYFTASARLAPPFGRPPAAFVIPRELEVASGGRSLEVVALTRQPALVNLISGGGSVNGFSTLLLPVGGDRRSPALHRAFHEPARLRVAASCGAYGFGAVRCRRLPSSRSRSLLTSSASSGATGTPGRRATGPFLRRRRNSHARVS